MKFFIYNLFLSCTLLFISPQVHKAQSVSTTERKVTKIADGVYAIQHPDAPNGFPQGNTTVVIGKEKVLVVDACYFPSSAKKDLDQIKEWTDKPVAYLINTHGHLDHNNGNYVYRDAFPGIAIISHPEAKKMISNDNKEGINAFLNKYVTLKKQTETGKDDNGKIIDEKEMETTKQYVESRIEVYSEFQKIKLTPPNTDITNEMKIDLGERKVEIKFLGKGNTEGDIVVYLPEEKIIAAGDLVVSPVPYAFGSYPSEWIKTLQQIIDLDVQAIIPGHGLVIRDNSYLEQIISVVNLVIAEVQKEVNKRSNPSGVAPTEEEINSVIKSIDWSEIKNQFCKGDQENEKFFERSMINGLIKATFAEFATK